MKKIALFCTALVFLFSFAVVANAETDVVVQMTCIIRLPDVIREGKYTGEVQNGVPHGYGMFEAVNSAGVGWHYIGEWDNGNMTGQGGQYWNNGKVVVGTFENGSVIEADTYDSPSFHGWTDYRPNENGLLRGILYREDGSIAADLLFDPVNNVYVEGTIYQKNGDVFFSGRFGEGFDFNSIIIE